MACPDHVSSGKSIWTKVVIMRVLILALLLSGCASGETIISGGAYPEGAAVYRCTEYDGSIQGRWTGANAQAEGCQCMQVGAELKGEVQIVAGDNCRMTFRPQ